MLKLSMFILLSLLIVFFAGMYFLGMKSKKAPTLGLINGQLQPCPSTPNCICSEYPGDESHYAEALKFDFMGDLIPTLEKAVLNTQGHIVETGDNYLRAQYVSSFFRFVDDLELRIDSVESKIHIRSASRVGKGDLGANKKRYLKLKDEIYSLISYSKN